MMRRRVCVDGLTWAGVLGEQSASDSAATPVRRLVAELRTPPGNERIYGVINENDPDVQALAKSIAVRGVLEPLVVSRDDYVVSGNRRLVAARMARLETVPVRIVDVRRSDPDFSRLLVEYNEQRVKTIDQHARELAEMIDPAVAHRRLVEERRSDEAPAAARLELGEWRGRSEIVGNWPLAEACIRIVRDMREHWPLSDRQIHYLLLNDPPQLHVSKPQRYANDAKSYRTLTNVLTRLRIGGLISFAAIADVTRPVTIWRAHANARDYLRDELNGFLKGYWRDLQRSQENHVELVVEKLTVQNIVEGIASDLTIPLTVARGFASIPPRHAMVERWRKSSKEKLVVVIVSDLDPAGMTIAKSFGRSLRDDFDVSDDCLHIVKAALTIEQVQELGLPPAATVKVKSSTAKEYVQRYGEHVWELEAVAPDVLKTIVRDACLSVMDGDRFNEEQQLEVKEAAEIQAYREIVLKTFDHGQKL